MGYIKTHIIRGHRSLQLYILRRYTSPRRHTAVNIRGAARDSAPGRYA